MMKILKAGKIVAIRTFQSTMMKVNGNRRTLFYNPFIYKQDLKTNSPNSF